MNRIKSISYLKSFYSFTVWRHFSFQWCIRQTVDKAMMQWSIDDSAIGNIWWHDRALRHHYWKSCHRTISLPFHLTIVIASSLHRSRNILLSHYRPKARWHDDVIVNYMALPGFLIKQNFVRYLFSLIKKNILVNMTYYNLKTT